jgi:hypothetical protein
MNENLLKLYLSTVLIQSRVPQNEMSSVGSTVDKTFAVCILTLARAYS